MKNKHFATIAALTGFTALTIHGINKFIFYSASLKNSLSDINGSYYDWRFGKIFYKTVGTGSPVLLIHDLNETSSGYEWNKVIEELAKKHTVYIIDLLGCGRSEKANITYTNYLYVQLISDFIKNVIKHKTDVIVTGISSSFTLMSCHTNPELYGKLILINPENMKSLNQVPSKRTKTLKYLINTPIIGTLIYNILTTYWKIEETFYENYICNAEHIIRQDIQHYYEAAHKGGANSKYLLSSLKGRYLNIHIGHALKQINNSIYLIAGEQYRYTEDIIVDYLEYNPAIEACIIPNTKLLPQLEAPKALLEQLHLFLDAEGI